MLKRNAICLAAAVPATVATVYMDTLAPGPPWKLWAYALDFGLVLPCWHLIALAAGNVLSYALPRKPRPDRAWAPTSTAP